MSRDVYLIRHAESTGGRYDRHLFPAEGPPLSEGGINDARKLQLVLKSYSISTDMKVAVSELIRTRQTAEQAGFKQMSTYSLLNEVNTGLAPEVLNKMIKERKVPEKAIAAARKLLDNPPKENIWFTHGLLIAGIGNVLNLPTESLYIPNMATITKITVD